MNVLLKDRYKPIRIIEEGKYFRVWLACDIYMNREVAIKIYRNSFTYDIVEGVRRQCWGMKLVHPNILPTYDFNHDEEILYIVMPYCPFGSINKLAGKISEWTLWRIIKDIASGLEHLHRQGIMHLDIKPANFLLDTHGHYVLSDFGLSHRVANLIDLYNKSITIDIAGPYNREATVYMSPENILDGRVDINSDIWSLGLSIYELISGELPVHGSGELEQLLLFGRVMTFKCDKCSTKLSNLIDACINPSPQNRPSATEIIALADSVIARDDIIPMFDKISDDSILKKEDSFYNTYNETSLNAMERYNVVKPTDKSIWYC